MRKRTISVPLCLLWSVAASAFLTPLPGLRTSSRPTTIGIPSHSCNESRLRALPFGGELGLLGNLLEQGIYLGESVLTTLPDLTLSQVQTTGETYLASMLMVAAIQGAMVRHQYETNPFGELIVPPGLTTGREDTASVTGQTARGVPAKSGVFVQGAGNTKLHWVNNESSAGLMKKGWYKVSKNLFLLLPVLAGPWSTAVHSAGHFIRLAALISAAKLYDIAETIPVIHDDGLHKCTEDCIATERSSEANIVVIGDSMALGIGSVDVFDEEKNSGLPAYRIEQLELNRDSTVDPSIGPVFPRVLARTLSERLRKPVLWRSAGVDGGDTTDIREHLLSVVREEVSAGRTPDAVVVLTGSNDMKNIIAFDKKNRASIRGFQSNLIQLVKDVQNVSPNTKVVFPALPTYRLDPGSILNVFPLNIFLDKLMGFWDSQKQKAADKCPSCIQYYDLPLEEVKNWYTQGGDETNNVPISLLAADGIHPNARCYAKWASYLGNQIADNNDAKQRQPCTQSQAHTISTRQAVPTI